MALHAELTKQTETCIGEHVLSARQKVRFSADFDILQEYPRMLQFQIRATLLLTA